MPTTKRTRTIGAPPEAVWKVVGDAHHLARWWPRVRRVEDVSDGRWTKVFLTEKGHSVRADYTLYTMLGFLRRCELKLPEIAFNDLTSPRFGPWMARIDGLPFAEACVPPHWKVAA